MFVITYRSGQILMNPFLLVSGWQLYELNVLTEGQKRCVKALSRDQIQPNDRLESYLVQDICFTQGKDSKKTTCKHLVTLMSLNLLLRCGYLKHFKFSDKSIYGGFSRDE